MSAGNTPEQMLCALLMNRGGYDEVVQIVHSSDFLDPKCRRLFEKVGELARAGEPHDALSVSERLPSDQQFEALELAEQGSDAMLHEVIHYARMVQRGARRRAVRDTLDEGLRRIDEGNDIDLVAEEVSSRVDATYRDRVEKATFRNLLHESALAIQNARKLRAEHGFVGASYSLQELDNRLGGMWGPSLIVVAARPSVGKSTLAWQMAMEEARSGHPVGIVDTEMGSTRIGIRVMSYFYGLNAAKLRLGIEDEVQTLIEKARQEPLGDLPVHVDSSSRDIYSICGQIGRWKREHDIRFAVVDYLQEVKVPGAKDRFEARGTVSEELKNLSLRLNMPIVLVSQLNRAVEKERRPPVLSDLRESGDIEQDADLVIALHGKLEADEIGERELELHILKAKDARVGKVPYHYHLNGRHYQIKEGRMML